MSKFAKKNLIPMKHVVKFRNGMKAFYVENRFEGEEIIISLASYSNNLTHFSNSDYDIYEVYEISSLKRIWGREEKEIDKKGIVIVNMPDECFQCKFWRTTSKSMSNCGLCNREVYAYSKPQWCPIKPIEEEGGI